ETEPTPRIEPKMPYTVDDEWEDCSPPPSMLRPRETEPAPRIEPKMPCTTDDEWDDCSPPPSMLRPRETEPTPRIEPKTPCTVDDEWEDCSPPPSMLRPRETKTKPALCKETAKLHDAMECASLQVRVTSGGQVLPVAGARVTIFYLGESNKKMRKDDVTDKNGNTQVFSIPISAPSAPCTIEVSASGFCSARYVGIELCSGTPTTQQIDLIELPPGHKSNLLILYDKLPIL
ncbi:MAG: carboxypeptidase-like regulatory domain-containing protein, partial [Oscillospiraceae bacterium]|nr:carboxypeptidase-like regulatory domain-containing protein [Oscillospiraceae bacterium]